MKIYVTKNSEYPVTMIDELEAITAVRGKNKGKLYGILGFLEDKTQSNSTFEGEVQFISEDAREKDYDLSRHLDKTPEKGKSIVAKLLDENGKFTDAVNNVIITSPIKEIRG